MFSNQLIHCFILVRLVIIILEKKIIICHYIADDYQAS